MQNLMCDHTERLVVSMYDISPIAWSIHAADGTRMLILPKVAVLGNFVGIKQLNGARMGLGYSGLRHNTLANTAYKSVRYNRALEHSDGFQQP